MKSTASQTSRLFDLLKDLQPHRTDEIKDIVYGPTCALARIASRIRDLKLEGYSINGWKDPKNPTLYYYHLRSLEKSIIPKKTEVKMSSFFNSKPVQLDLIVSKIYTDY